MCGVAHYERGVPVDGAFMADGDNPFTVSHELPSQTDWITRVSRTLVQLGFVPSLVLATVVLVPIFAMLSPLLVMALGRGSAAVAAQVGALSALILVPAHRRAGAAPAVPARTCPRDGWQCWPRRTR